MLDIKVTMASLYSELNYPEKNMDRLRNACKQAQAEGARILLAPELQLSGHGGHLRMIEHAEPVPSGPMSSTVVALSKEYDLCLVVGLVEKVGDEVFNSQMVADRGTYLGLQRKIHLSGDENDYFKPGEKLELFDIDEVRFGIMICRDNLFPELATALKLQGAELILSPFAARSGVWPENPSPEYFQNIIKARQNYWETTRARAYDNKVYNLMCNAVGSSTAGLENVVANHAGTVMAIDPKGKIFQRTTKTDMTEEILTVELNGDMVKPRGTDYRKRHVEVALKLLNDSKRYLDSQG